jgi:OmpA-OmpF porin, OOP family
MRAVKYLPGYRFARRDTTVMTRTKCFSVVLHATFSLILFVPLQTRLVAQTGKVDGLIKARNGGTILLQPTSGEQVTVLLTDNTQVSQKEGVLKVRKKEMSMATLIPGLEVHVEGTYDPESRLTAKLVTFKGNDLARAQAIQAGIHENEVQTKQNKEELQKQNAELGKQNAELEKHTAELQEQNTQLKTQKAEINAAVDRFGELDDYYIRDEVTVYFANGTASVDPKYVSQLQALAEKAKTINGYMIEVKGYASAVGSTTVNQKLSEDRANNVTYVLQQKGDVPLTRMLAPGAMGESQQIGNDKTRQGQAENRRVVVRILQNKAVAGA